MSKHSAASMAPDLSSYDDDVLKLSHFISSGQYFHGSGTNIFLHFYLSVLFLLQQYQILYLKSSTIGETNIF